MLRWPHTSLHDRAGTRIPRDHARAGTQPPVFRYESHAAGRPRVHSHSLTEEAAVDKLTLLIEELRVESFATGAEGPKTGTVHAHHHTGNHETCANTCPATCRITCPETCFVSCDGAATCIDPTCGFPTCACTETEPYVSCIQPC